MENDPEEWEEAEEPRKSFRELYEEAKEERAGVSKEDAELTPTERARKKFIRELQERQRRINRR